MGGHIVERFQAGADPAVERCAGRLGKRLLDGGVVEVAGKQGGSGFGVDV